MSEVPVDTLVKYGTEFQTKCVVALMGDRPFVEQSLDVLNPAYFESDANKWIVEKIVWYFQSYRSLPTFEVFKRESDKIAEGQDVLKVAVVNQLRNIYMVHKSNPDDLEYIKKELLTFCKNQALKSAVLKSVDLLQRGEYDQIKVEVDKALHAGAERNIGHVWVDDVDDRLVEDARNVVPTPWECVNAIMGGGLGEGEIGCIVAPSGIGKSWVLTAIGAHAMKMGKRVAHYTLELSEKYMGRRYDSYFTGIEPGEVHKHPNVVKSAISQVPGQLVIKYFPTRTININAIYAHLNRLVNLGTSPDIILIDYPDLMRSACKSDARHEELGFIHEEIRGLLGEFKIPGWTASQSQRSSIQDDVVEADKIAGSYAKIMTDDYVMSVSRKVADKMTNTGRGYIIKNRFGPDGQTFPAEIDLSRGLIEFHDETSAKGMMLKQKIQSGQGVLKKMLSQKLIDFSNTPQPDAVVTPSVDDDQGWQ